MLIPGGTGCQDLMNLISCLSVGHSSFSVIREAHLMLNRLYSCFEAVVLSMIRVNGCAYRLYPG